MKILVAEKAQHCDNADEIHHGINQRHIEQVMPAGHKSENRDQKNGFGAEHINCRNAVKNRRTQQRADQRKPERNSMATIAAAYIMAQPPCPGWLLPSRQ